VQRHLISERGDGRYRAQLRVKLRHLADDAQIIGSDRGLFRDEPPCLFVASCALARPS
jgi:hypothetical protein